MDDAAPHPLTRLAEDDLNMVAAFVLASGSIKDLAARYGVSYPTMRQRLDRLIERLGEAMAGRPPDPLAHYLADLIARGQISPAAARRIRELHREAVQSADVHRLEGVNSNV